MLASRNVAMSLYLNQREMKIPIIILSGSSVFRERRVEIIENSVYINGEKLEEDYETTEINDVGIVT